MPDHRPRSWILAAVLLPAVLVLAGCGGSGDPAAGGSTTGSPSGSDGATTVDITIRGDTVEPGGTRVQVRRGAPVVLRISADAAGELHVHSSPEQEISFPAGSSTRRLVVEQPGIVDVEDHRLEKVVVQLQVG